MSSHETGRKLTVKNEEKLDRKITGMIAAALREDYGTKRHAIKRIRKAVNIDSLNTVKAWYEGRNLPNFVHLILLAHHSPAVMRVVMELLNKEGYAEQYFQVGKAVETTENNVPPMPIYTEQSFGINVQVNIATGSKLNVRQLWFLGLLQRGYAVKAEHIAQTWHVTSRASESDVAKMVRAEIIRFVGAKKTGHYEYIGAA